MLGDIYVTPFRPHFLPHPASHPHPRGFSKIDVHFTCWYLSDIVALKQYYTQSSFGIF